MAESALRAARPMAGPAAGEKVAGDTAGPAAAPANAGAAQAQAEASLAALGTQVAAIASAFEAKLDAAQRKLEAMAASIEAMRRSQAVYFGDHVVCTTLHNGRRILVDTRSFDVGIHLIFGGSWEPMLSKVFERMLFKGAGVLDVGANHGYYSVIAGPIIGPTGLLIALEANPEMAQLLQGSFRINSLLRFGEVHNIAVSNAEQGVVDLIVHPATSGGAQIRPSTSRMGEASAAKTRTHRVGVTTIDALLGPERRKRINVVKMDIEGAEGAAFEGMASLLREARPLRILFEYNGQNAPVPRAFSELRPVLEAEGFEPLNVVHESRLEVMGWDALLANPKAQDIVLARKDDHGWITVA